MFGIDSDHLVLLTLVLVVLMLLRTTILRFRKNAQAKRQYDHSLRLAKETERQQRLQTAVPKSKIITTQSRIPTSDPFGQPFTGSIQGFAAKWEAEIHQLGRQIIGQIDSKMAALQAITLDANRTANRLEILVEHLEAIARQQIEGNIIRESDEVEKDQTEDTDGNIPSSIIPITDVLKELSEDIESIRKTVRQSPVFQESVEPAVVVRLAEWQNQQPNSFPAASSFSKPANPVPADSMSAHVRNEAEMLLNYGIKPEEIASRLNISLGEVDLIMQIQNHRTR